MRTVNWKNRLAALAVLGLWGLGCGAAAWAQPQRERQPHRPAPPPARAVLDARYHHDHYYPVRGYVTATLPAGALSVNYRGGSWFFHSGVWFRPQGLRYVVAVPPAGIVVPALPPAHVTVWMGGVPYYYANSVYYVYGPAGYVVAAPPAGIENAPVAPAVVMPAPAPEPAPAASNPGSIVATGPVTTATQFAIYPRNAQTATQTQADQQACNNWSNTQAGVSTDPGLFQRGFAACMDARGYTVR